MTLFLLLLIFSIYLVVNVAGSVMVIPHTRTGSNRSNFAPLRSIRNRIKSTRESTILWTNKLKDSLTRKNMPSLSSTNSIESTSNDHEVEYSINPQHIIHHIIEY